MHALVAWDALGPLAIAMAWTMAGFVYFTAPGRSVNRRFALCLALEGFAHVVSGVSFTHDPATLRGLLAVHLAAVLALPPLYLWFLATQDSPLAAPLRRPRARLAPPLLALGLAAGMLALPGVFLEPADATQRARDAAYLAFGAVSLYALAVSWSALRRAAPGTLAHRRARSFALGFGWRDAWFAAYLLPVIGLGFAGIDVQVQRPLDDAPALATMGLVLLVGWGILRTQLFDIEVRLKWGIRRGTVAAMFLAVFFVVAQLAQNLLTDELGWALGGLTAGLLLFAIAPLQRFAERVADAAMPGVRPAAERGLPERAALFREQAAIAWADGALDRSERALLEHLRERLGLTRDEAARLEAEAFGGLPGRGPRETMARPRKSLVRGRG